MPGQYEFLQVLFISAAVGGLVGIEREMKVKVVAGVRTFSLTSMLGALSVYFSGAIDGGYLIMIAFTGVVFIALLMGVVKHYKLGDVGVTTLVAYMITFILGAMVGRGLYIEAIAGSVVVTGLLASKEYSKKFSETLSHREIINALQFGIIAFVLYPVVPDKTIDPYGVINPKILLLVTIIVTTIGFAGYIALKKIGYQRGLPLIGAIGGLFNSEATTSALAARMKGCIELYPLVLQGILLTNSVMLLRNLVIAGVVSLAVFKAMFYPQFIMVLACLLYYVLLKPGQRSGKIEIPVAMPFAIIPALIFASMFVLVSWGVNLVKDYGIGSVYLAALLGGLVSSAATTASFASLYATGNLDLGSASIACVVSAIGSTLNKVTIAWLTGSLGLSKRLVKPMLIIAAIGTLALLLKSLWGS
jgi:uncharacterized membrane protein (DUF4010 family)